MNKVPILPSRGHNMKLTLILCLLFTSLVYPKTIYVSPDGSGDGSSQELPLGSLSQAIGKLDPGDELILLDGEYRETLSLNGVNGTISQRITIQSQNMCRAFINGEVKRTHAVLMRNCDNITIDGIKAGNTLHAVWSLNDCDNLILKRCAGFNAGYLEAQDAHVKNTYEDNCHIFGIAYSDNVLAEDVWAWGTGRYNFLYFQCTNSIVRRGVFRGTAAELGYGYDRCPHAGFNIYDCDNSIAENCIAFETRVHPDSDHNENNEWGLVQGGMVFDDHTLPSGYNYVLGCFDLDNGQERTVVPRSNPAVHLMSKWSGTLEDVVIWKNALGYGIIKGTSGTVDLPRRALIGSPSKLKQNTAVDFNLNYRYVDGELTDTPLWPWPYEEKIKELMDMDETMTEYVQRMVKPYVNIQPQTRIVASETTAPFTVHLQENYPNPFNPKTTITYAVNKAEHVTLQVYDLSGRIVRTLVSGPQASGEHQIQWDATNDYGQSVAGGVYLYRLNAGDRIETRKMMLLR